MINSPNGRRYTFEASDLGPVKLFRFEAPPHGVAVVKGPMGAGKSLLIEGIEATSRGEGKPPIADGANRAEVRMGSLTLKVGKRNQRSGELDFAIADGRFTIKDLIDPPFKSRDSRDSHAIKTLAQLSGSADESLFYDLVGGQEAFASLCPVQGAASKDVVAMAGQVQRALQSKALDEERAGESADSKADAYTAGARDVDTTQPHDQAKLDAEHESAVRALATLEQQAREADKRITDARAAKDALEDAEAEFGKMLSIEQAEAQVATARVLLLEREARMRELEQELAKVTAETERAASAVREAETTLQSVQTNSRTLAGFRETVAKGADVKPIPDAELIAARERVTTAKEATAQGVLIRKALADLANAREWREKGKEHRSAAGNLRDAASGVDDVLSGLVAKLGSQLFVERSQLLVNSDRGKESFWELSDGERSEVAVTVFAHATRAACTEPDKPCLLALPQSFWEGLDWQGRNRIAALMEQLNVLAWTAESDKEPGVDVETGAAVQKPLRVEMYEPQAVAAS